MLKAILKSIVSDGFSLSVCDENEQCVDYEGANVSDAIEAIEGVDETTVYIISPEGEKVGGMFIVNEYEQEPEDQIADHWGLGNHYCQW